MDRTVSLCDSWYFFNGSKKPGKSGVRLHKRVLLPQSGTSVFTLKRKFVCPKQVNDTVTVFFKGDYKSLEVFAGKERLSPVSDGEKTVFDVTKALRTGKTVITAVVSEGSVENFFFSVKRNYE